MYTGTPQFSALMFTWMARQRRDGGNNRWGSKGTSTCKSKQAYVRRHIVVISYLYVSRDPWVYSRASLQCITILGTFAPDESTKQKESGDVNPRMLGRGRTMLADEVIQIAAADIIVRHWFSQGEIPDTADEERRYVSTVWA